ncbi:MAG TPA: hypothetical protein VFJ74_10830 [Gemmatimonadaceae bacterium]|nr:hypothetical protein [Gemmatimonadaceae bacterium]
MNDGPRTPNTESEATGARWASPLTAKQRTAVQRAVDALLDELAPEVVVSRADRLPVAALQRLRTPRGCILQAPTGAVSVSWFPDSPTEADFGELQVVGWRGVVSRPGSANRSEGAKAVRELVLRPVERAPDAWEWQAGDGSATFDTSTLAAYCIGLLEEQTGPSQPGAANAAGR